MPPITVTTTIAEMREDPFLSPYVPYLFTGSGVTEVSLSAFSPEYLQQEHPTWNAGAMCRGLQRLRELSKEGKAEIRKTDPSDPSVAAICLHAEQKSTETTAVLFAGGGFGAVCTMAESLPAAAVLTESGMDCVIFNYPTIVPGSTTGLLPRALESVDRLLEELSIEDYLLCGFSAGGYLAALWSLPSVGWKLYGKRAPRALFLGYPLLSMKCLPESPMRTYMETGLFAGMEEERREHYDVLRSIDPAFLPTFLIQAEDDDTIPIRSGREAERLLTEYQVPHVTVFPKTGGHGFGIGAEHEETGHWLEQAFRWYINRK